MTANAATFPTPPVSMGDLQAAIDDHVASCISLGWKGNRGSMAVTSLRDVTRNALQVAVDANSAYVQAIARSLAPTSPIFTQMATVLLGGYSNKNRGRLNLPTTFGMGTGSHDNNATRVNRQPAMPKGLKIVFPRIPIIGETRIRWGKVKSATSYGVFSCNPITGAPVGQVATTTQAGYVVNAASGTSDCIRIRAYGPFNTFSGLSQPIFFTTI